MHFKNAIWLFLAWLNIQLLVLANTEKVIFRAGLPSALPIIELGRDCRFANIQELSGPYSISTNQIIRPSILEFEENAERIDYCFYENRNKVIWYVLRNLKPGTLYEARISYLSTTPGDWELKVFSREELFAMYGIKYNSDKSESHEKSDNTTEMNTTAYLRVRMFPTGVSYVDRGLRLPTKFNIVLESLILGGIPYQATKVVTACAFAVLFGMVFAVPLLFNVINEVIEENEEGDKVK